MSAAAHRGTLGGVGNQMTAAPITRKRIDELLRFLPQFGNPGSGTGPEWSRLNQGSDLFTGY
jgi:hypothetical protein